MSENPVAVITGGAKGIGRHAAKTFAQHGYRIAIADIGPMDKVEADVGELGAEVLTIPTDVRDEQAVAAMMRRTADHYGRIDVLVNDAGIVPHFAWGIPRWPRIRDMEQSFWDKVLDTNLGGTFLATKHVLPYMEAQRSGHVVNLHGGGAGPGACPYVVSKDAIRTFTKFVADEEREFNIVVVAVAPGGAIATEDASEEARGRLPGPESLEDVFVLAAQTSMEQSGHVVQLRDGALATIS